MDKKTDACKSHHHFNIIFQYDSNITCTLVQKITSNDPSDFSNMNLLNQFTNSETNYNYKK